MNIAAEWQILQYVPYLSKLYIYCERIPWIARVIYTVQQNILHHAVETTVVADCLYSDNNKYLTFLKYKY